MYINGKRARLKMTRDNLWLECLTVGSEWEFRHDDGKWYGGYTLTNADTFTGYVFTRTSDGAQLHMTWNEAIYFKNEDKIRMVWSDDLYARPDDYEEAE